MTFPLRVDGPEVVGKQIGPRGLLEVQHHVRIGQGFQDQSPVVVGTFTPRAWRRWRRDRRRESDLSVTRCDVLRGAGHALCDDGLSRSEIFAVVTAEVCRRYRGGGQEGRRGTVTQPGGFPAAGQALG